MHSVNDGTSTDCCNNGCTNASSSTPRRKSILINREAEDSEESLSFAEAKKRKKKKVSFADTQGERLLTVRRLVDEPSFPDDFVTAACASKLKLNPSDLFGELEFTSKSFAHEAPQVAAINNKPPDIIPSSFSYFASESSPWRLQFPQPSTADYLLFRQKLAQNNVMLETVIITKENALTGLIKVKNIAYEKSVGIRITYNEWRSCCDVAATYVDDITYDGSNYDSFTFTVYLPPLLGAKKEIEFCVWYLVQGQAFWDNNDDKNYMICYQETDEESAIALLLEDSSGRQFHPLPSRRHSIDSPDDGN